MARSFKKMNRTFLIRVALALWATGFDVVPRVSGENVSVEIAQQRETGDSFQRASTTAGGRVWLKVEKLP